jgi:cytochrome c peroxidase
MNKRWIYIPLVLLVLFGTAFTVIKINKNYLDYPDYWPVPAYDFKKNPVTEEGFQLGRKLFYEPDFSRDGTISCASCHLQATGFTHVDHDLSHGIDGRIGKRNSLALMNLAWNTSFMWDGGVNHIDMQALQPITSKDEMDSSLKEVVEKLNTSSKYRKLFYKVFKDSIITGQHTLKALSQFTVSLNSYTSKYDKYIRKEDNVTFTDQEKSGLELFKNNCSSCHKAPLFTAIDFKNNGLSIDTTLNDYGRYGITKNPADSLKFKVPTLRNIQFTAPYMHDGRFESLREVLDHYVNPVNHNKTTDVIIKGIDLSQNDKTDLLVFLKTLSDFEFLYDTRYSFPREIPKP